MKAWPTWTITPPAPGFFLKDPGEDAPRQSTIEREACFLNFAKGELDVAKMPIMVVGGFRSIAVMVEAIDNAERDVVGIALPMIVEPDAPKRLLSGETERLPIYEKMLHILHLLPWNDMQPERLGDSLEPDLSMRGESTAEAFMELESRNTLALLENRKRADA